MTYEKTSHFNAFQATVSATQNISNYLDNRVIAMSSELHEVLHKGILLDPWVVMCYTIAEVLDSIRVQMSLRANAENAT